MTRLEWLSTLRQSKNLLWLESEFNKQGHAVTGPFADESGWMLEVPSGKGFVVAIVTGPDGGNTRFNMLVTEYNGAAGQVCDAIAGILQNSNEIVEFEVEH